MKPNTNLWAVTVTFDVNDTEQLWILAASAATATSKAERFMRKRGERGFEVTKVKHEGTIDVF